MLAARKAMMAAGGTPPIWSANHPDLTAFYRMDDADVSGGVLTDVSLAGNDATLTGTTSTTGKLAQARLFNGSSDVITAPTNLVPTTGEFCTCGWFNLTDLSDTRPLWGQYYNNVNNRTNFAVITSGRIVLQVGATVFQSPIAVTAAVTYFVMLQREPGGQVRLYLNNPTMTLDTFGSAATLDNQATTLGHYGEGAVSEFIKGWMDHWRFFKRSLTLNERLSLWNGGVGI